MKLPIKSKTSIIKVRPVNDPEGDVGICLIFYLDSSSKVQNLSKRLRLRG